MPDLFPVSLLEQIACVEREIALRQSVYPRRVQTHQMSRTKAEKEIEAMQAVLATLVFIRDNGVGEKG